jgi:hypothetical protein
VAYRRWKYLAYFGAERKSLLHVPFPFGGPFFRLIQILASPGAPLEWTRQAREDGLFQELLNFYAFNQAQWMYSGLSTRSAARTLRALRYASLAGSAARADMESIVCNGEFEGACAVHVGIGGKEGRSPG